MAPVAVEGWDVAGGEATGGKAADGVAHSSASLPTSTQNLTNIDAKKQL